MFYHRSAYFWARAPGARRLSFTRPTELLRSDLHSTRGWLLRTNGSPQCQAVMLWQALRTYRGTNQGCFEDVKQRFIRHSWWTHINKEHHIHIEILYCPLFPRSNSSRLPWDPATSSNSDTHSSEIIQLESRSRDRTYQPEVIRLKCTSESRIMTFRMTQHKQCQETDGQNKKQFPPQNWNLK